jgi:DNA-binding CsgD family transcriptional regulator/PAS domain-containing protein
LVIFTPPSRLEQFSNLVHLIYAASAEPNRWPEAVAAVAQSMGAMQACLLTPYAGPHNGGLLFPWRVEEKDLIRWATKYIDHDVWSQSALRKGLWRDGNVVTDEDLLPQDDLRASVFYKEFLNPMGVARLCTGAIFSGAPGLPATTLSIYRGPDDPAFGPHDREFMRLLVPHLSRSLGLMHRLGLARQQVASLRAALDRLSVGVFLLDATLGVRFANAAAQQVLARGDGLHRDVHGRLNGRGRAGPGTGARRLEHWLADLVALPESQRSGFGDVFKVQRSQADAHYSVQCCPLAPEDPLLLGEGAHHIVFVTDPRRVDLPAPADLQAQLGLTPAECRVTHGLAQGATYREVAGTLGIGEETVRTHVKSIYAKTRTNNKAGLTRLVLSLARAAV